MTAQDRSRVWAVVQLRIEVVAEAVAGQVGTGAGRNRRTAVADIVVASRTVPHNCNLVAGEAVCLAPGKAGFDKAGSEGDGLGYTLHKEIAQVGCRVWAESMPVLTAMDRVRVDRACVELEDIADSELVVLDSRIDQALVEVSAVREDHCVLGVQANMGAEQTNLALWVVKEEPVGDARAGTVAVELEGKAGVALGSMAGRAVGAVQADMSNMVLPLVELDGAAVEGYAADIG
ncbi:hypothetical protein HDV00_010240 [Rhizophlyctis rosea]|nr:hypothetical protein HDV00_010240 [Rhizophlyctis rosea]